MNLLALMFAGILPASLSKQCEGTLPDGTACQTKRMYLSRNKLCPECQQRHDQNSLSHNSGFLSSRRKSGD